MKHSLTGIKKYSFPAVKLYNRAMKKEIRIKVIVAMLALLVAGLVMAYDMSAGRSRTGNNIPDDVLMAGDRAKIPDFSFATLDDVEHEITTMAEPVILLHFWASWCGTCITEFPALFELIQKHKGRVALIAVSIDDKYDVMTRFLQRFEKRQGLKTDRPHIYWVWDEGQKISRERFGVVRVPETIFIDRNRFMITKMVGETDWLGEKVSRRLALMKD